MPIRVGSPLYYFRKMIDDSIIEDIVEFTNLYSTQRTGSSINVTNMDIWDFISVLLIMGILKLPQYTDYWSRDLNINIVSNKMSLKRFQLISRYLHFCNNDLYCDEDRYFQVRPFLEKLRQNFLQIGEETVFSIDEMMIPYKGTRAGSRKQYLPKNLKNGDLKFSFGMELVE